MKEETFNEIIINEINESYSVINVLPYSIDSEYGSKSQYIEEDYTFIIKDGNIKFYGDKRLFFDETDNERYNPENINLYQYHKCKTQNEAIKFVKQLILLKKL